MSELAGEFLYADRYFLVCRGDHPLAQVEQARLRDIARYPLIQLARGKRAQAPGRGIRRGRATAGVRGGASGHGDRPGKGGLGVSVVPAMTLFHFGGEDLRIVPLAGRADATAALAARGAQPVGGGAGLV